MMGRLLLTRGDQNNWKPEEPYAKLPFVSEFIFLTLLSRSRFGPLVYFLSDHY